MNVPQFSIIVPIYNVEKYLKRAIDSVLNQTFIDFELILVNDGSTDNSLKICNNEKKDGRVIVIDKKNGGQSSARNSGLDIAKGNYILFIDSDDFWLDNSVLDNIYQKISSHNSDVILFGCRDTYLNTGKYTYSRYHYDIDQFGDDTCAILKHLYKTNHFPGSAWIMAVKHSIIKTKNLRFPLGVSGEDILWINSILTNCTKIGAIEKPLYAYHKGRPGQLTSKATIKGCSGMINAINNWIPKSDNAFYKGITYQMCKIYLILLMHYAQLERNERYNIEKQVLYCSKILKNGSAKDITLFFVNKIIGPRLLGKIINYIHHLRK